MSSEIINKMSNETINSIDENSIFWKEFKTKKGVKYEVGYLKESDLSEEKESEILKKNGYGVSVYWPVGDKNWKDTDSDVQSKVAIRKYRLYGISGPYNYRLDFINTKKYTYHFHDEAGNSYYYPTYKTEKAHCVRYNSDKPTIIYIDAHE